ncbi:hypothetical protein RB195_011009 [Necator americanus]|uniref:Ground-like domain protein n=1 Tax=Necator americanus TaxID=51031 RepID=A0ABR1D293_NECAM
MAGLKDEECRTKFRQRVSTHVGVWNRKKIGDADSFTKCVKDAAWEAPRFYCGAISSPSYLRKQNLCIILHAPPAALMISLKNSKAAKASEKEFASSMQQDRDNDWALRAKEFEKAWEAKIPRKICFTKTVNKKMFSSPQHCQ